MNWLLLSPVATSGSVIYEQGVELVACLWDLALASGTAPVRGLSGVASGLVSTLMPRLLKQVSFSTHCILFNIEIFITGF